MVSPNHLYRGPRPPPHHPAVARNPIAATAEWNAPDASSHEDGGLFGRTASWQVDLEIRPPRGPFARRRHAHGENVDIRELIQRHEYEPVPGERRDRHEDALGMFAVVAPAAAAAGRGGQPPSVSLQATCKSTYDTWDAAEEAADAGWAAAMAAAEALANHGGWAWRPEGEAGAAAAAAGAAPGRAPGTRATAGGGGGRCGDEVPRPSSASRQVETGTRALAPAAARAGRMAQPLFNSAAALPPVGLVSRSVQVVAQIYAAVAALAGSIAVAMRWGSRPPPSRPSE